jgi:hypothetical protein
MVVFNRIDWVDMDVGRCLFQPAWLFSRPGLLAWLAWLFSGLAGDLTWPSALSP